MKRDFTVLEYLDDFKDELNKNFKQGKGKNKSIYKKRITDLAWRKLHKFIETLHKNPETTMYAKMLKLELEYIRKAEKDELIHRVEIKTGMPAGGEYTLEEVGKVLGVTRERVRQIEVSVIGKNDIKTKKNKGGFLHHPEVARKLRKYREDKQ